MRRRTVRRRGRKGRSTTQRGQGTSRADVVQKRELVDMEEQLLRSQQNDKLFQEEVVVEEERAQRRRTVNKTRQLSTKDRPKRLSDTDESKGKDRDLGREGFVDGVADVGEDVGWCAVAVDGDDFVLVGAGDGGDVFVILGDAVGHFLDGVVGADDETFGDFVGGRGLVLDVVDLARDGVLPPAAGALHHDGVRNFQQEKEIRDELHVLEGVALLLGARHAVQQPPVLLRLRGLHLGLADADDELVGDEVAALHERLGFFA
mmetsp:Transcript_7448/g.22970  ORF Transcript_7448/g.22970 Transcript_7448/m.22970 type:complete len:261 (+) Transcript_7448:97-879(+)